MSYKDYIKDTETVWCAGCGLGLLLQSAAKALDSLSIPKENVVVVSGIGCTARGSGYFNCDSVNGIHGRALCIAEGIKRANEKLHVIVFSGDGDLTGIGGNHLLHTSRRDVNITVICANNEIYGMTGGQKSPMTPKGVKTMTSPKGNRFNPVNIQGIITSNRRHFFARSTVFHIEHMKKCIEEAIKWDGFSFVEVKTQCISNYGRRVGFKSAYEMLMNFKNNFKMNSDGTLNENEIGIMKSEE